MPSETELCYAVIFIMSSKKQKQKITAHTIYVAVDLENRRILLGSDKPDDWIRMNGVNVISANSIYDKINKISYKNWPPHRVPFRLRFKIM